MLHREGNRKRGHYPLDEYPLRERTRTIRLYKVILFGINEDNRDGIPGGTELLSYEIESDNESNACCSARDLHDAALEKQIPGYKSKLFCSRLMWRAEVKK